MIYPLKNKNIVVLPYKCPAPPAVCSEAHWAGSHDAARRSHTRWDVEIIANLQNKGTQKSFKGADWYLTFGMALGLQLADGVQEWSSLEFGDIGA